MTEDCNNLGDFNLSGIPPAPRGTPQIEVTFDVDANGILNVNAVNKASGKTEKIRIERNGQLNQQDIDRMVADAESFKAEDDAQRERVAAKNGFEAYAYGMKQTLEGDAVKGKIDEAERGPVLQKITEAMSWLDANQLASKDEFEHSQKELESVCNPLVAKLNSAPGAGPQAAHANGTTVEEVD